MSLTSRWQTCCLISATSCRWVSRLILKNNPFSFFYSPSSSWFPLCAAHTRPLKCLFNGRLTDGTVEKLRPLCTTRLLIFTRTIQTSKYKKKSNQKSVSVSNLLMGQSAARARTRLFLVAKLIHSQTLNVLFGENVHFKRAAGFRHCLVFSSCCRWPRRDH